MIPLIFAILDQFQGVEINKLNVLPGLVGNLHQ